MGLTGLDAVDLLFAGDPSEFVAARDALAKARRVSGDREGAAAIKALRRPSVAAWYVNVAARASLVSLREWLTLGASLREAQETLDMARVKSLSSGRAALENRVVRDLSAHLTTLGATVSASALDEVRATLRAALASADAARLVSSGRLERALTYGGFGEVDLTAAMAAMTAAAALAASESEQSRLDPPSGSTAEQPDPNDPEPEPQPDPALIAAVDDARLRRDHAEAALAVAQRELREAHQRLAAAERALNEALQL